MRYLIASMAIAASTTFTALGATLYVTPTGAGNKDGSSWANAFAGIQAAAGRQSLHLVPIVPTVPIVPVCPQGLRHL